jgi:hypothetical protein
MGAKVSGIINTEEMLLRLDSTAKRRVVKVLVKRAEQIRDLARKMAPVDEGNLEEAIKLRGDAVGRTRDEFGRFQRTEVDVYIDMDAPVPERPGHTVGDYAYEMHEHLTPMGPMQLGPASVAKQEGQQEQVGGGFLERAAEEVVAAGMEEELMDILRDIV